MEIESILIILMIVSVGIIYGTHKMLLPFMSTNAERRGLFISSVVCAVFIVVICLMFYITMTLAAKM